MTDYSKEPLGAAVLPGYEYLLSRSNAKVFPYNDTNDIAGSYGVADNPARAWLLAIVRALIAKEKRSTLMSGTGSILLLLRGQHDLL